MTSADTSTVTSAATTTATSTVTSADTFAADMARRSSSQPFWRRPRRLRRQITATLMTVALVAIVLFGALNYYAADRLLLDGTTTQLESEAAMRAQSTELGAARLVERVQATSSEPGVVAALDDFATAFDGLSGQTLTPDESAALEAAYEERVVAPINELDVTTITLADVLPRTDAGRWIQYRYTLPADARSDGAPTEPTPAAAAYDAAISTHDATLTALADTFGGDLLLIDADSNIVYSAEKRIDIGTNLVDGPHAGSDLAELVTEELGRVRAGDALLTDFSVYVPGGARPVLFAAAVIRDGNEIVGTLAVEVPVTRIDAITSGGAASGAAGLDEVDSYIVSDTLVLQSTPQSWVADPQAYLDGIADPEVERLVEILGSPVGIEVIDTEPVRDALDGTPFAGRSTNAAGASTYSSSTSIDVPGASWAVVTEIPLSVARDPLYRFLLRMAVVTVVLLPLAALAGFLLARRLTRPIPVVVEAASAVADGERRLDLPDLGRNEFGDLGRRLTRMAATLERQEQALEDEYERKRQLLLTVLPPHLVDDDGAVSGTGERVDEATVIAVTIDTDSSELDAQLDLADALATATASAERLATDRGIERIRVAADRSLFVTGTGNDDTGADAALGFATALITELWAFADEAGITLAPRVGISTGQVATGILARGNLTFAAWGEPVRRALAINALSKPDEILVDQSTLDAATDRWNSAPADDVVDLDQQPIAVRSLTVQRSPDVTAS